MPAFFLGALFGVVLWLLMQACGLSDGVLAPVLQSGGVVVLLRHIARDPYSRI